MNQGIFKMTHLVNHRPGRTPSMPRASASALRLRRPFRGAALRRWRKPRNCCGGCLGWENPALYGDMKILWGDLWLNLDLETIVNLDFIIIELVLTWENIGKSSRFLKVKGEFLFSHWFIHRIVVIFFRPPKQIKGNHWFTWILPFGK